MLSGRIVSAGNGTKGLVGDGEGHVQEVVKAAQEELRQLLRQRAEVMKRIGTVKQTIVGLANLFGDEVLSEELLELVDRKSSGRQPGFTKACRMVLMEAAVPWAPAKCANSIQTAHSAGAAPSQRSVGVGHHGAKPSGGIRRSANRSAGKRAAGLAMGGRSRRQRLRSDPRRFPFPAV